MKLKEFLPVYVSRRLDLKPSTVQTYSIAVSKIDEWKRSSKGGPIHTEDLSINLVSDWLSNLARVEKLKPRSVNSYRSSICAIWSGAMRAGLAPVTDNRIVPSCRVPRQIPIAWTMDQLKLLIEAARSKKGRRKNEWKSRRSDFWTGLYLFLYDTGSRFGAALSLECRDVDLRSRRALLASDNSKTRTDHMVSFSDDTAEFLSRLIDDGHKLVWPNGKNRQELYEEHKRTLISIGLPFDRYHMFHIFRKTCATQLAIASSVEDASKALGHSSTNITSRVYVDSRQLPFVSVSNALPRPIEPDEDRQTNIVPFSRLG